MPQPGNSAETNEIWQPWEPACLNLTPRDVHVCRLGVVPWPAEPESNLIAIDEEERSRAARFVRPEDRSRFVAGRLLLRRLLAGCLGCAPADLVFKPDKYGRPRLTSPPRKGLDFNISHSGRWVLVALANHRRVGVDTEKIRGNIDIISIMRELFSPAEQIALTRMSDEERLRAFFWYWTRKEAIAKAIGTGLGAPLAELEVSTDILDGWEVRTITVGPQNRAAVAASGADWKLSCWTA